ncbi:MAG TPA: cupin domain-containing protein [Chloroflexia bacterium]|nr:cupin domain-containing protein [Chloroflexia bacterium]
MRIERADPRKPKGWYLGPWNSDLGISVGYANQGIDEPHLHRQTTEIYMVGRGTSEMQVGHELVTLSEGDIIVVQPGEAHTFLSSSADYFHFVMHIPGLQGDEAHADKVAVDARLLGQQP